MPYPDFWILYNIIITRLLASLYTITARLPASFLYNDNQISSILHIFIIDKTLLTMSKFMSKLKMTSELVLAVLLFSLGLSVPVPLTISIALIVVASSFLLQFLDDADKSNGYGKYHKDKNNP